MASRRNRRWWWCASLLVSLTACGSELSRQEMLQANLEAFRAAAVGTGPVIGQGAGALTPGAGEDSLAGQPAVGAETAIPAAIPGIADDPAGSAPSQGVASAGGTTTNSSGASPGRTQTTALGGGARPAPATPGPGQPENAGPAGAAPGGATAELVLGVLGVQSGPIGSVMVPILQAAKAWASDVNARGGAGGHPVRLVIADDGGDPARALALAKRMVEQDKVVAFYAAHASTTLQAFTPYLEQQQIPILGACECNPTVDESPMVFHLGTGAKTSTYWAHLAPVLELSDKRKLAILYCREASTCSGLNDGIKRMAPSVGIQVVFSAQVSLAQPDFTAEVISARNAGADAVVTIADNATIVRVARSAHRQGWEPLIAAQQAAHDTRFLRDGGADVEGAVLAATTAPWPSAPSMADYRAAMDRYAPGGVKASLGAWTWLTGKLIEQLAAAFPAQPSPKNFLDGLYALKGETLGGRLPPITFERGKGHEATNQCVITVRVNKGEFVSSGDDRFSCKPGWKPVGQ